MARAAPTHASVRLHPYHPAPVFVALAHAVLSAALHEKAPSLQACMYAADVSVADSAGTPLQLYPGTTAGMLACLAVAAWLQSHVGARRLFGDSSVALRGGGHSSDVSGTDAAEAASVPTAHPRGGSFPSALGLLRDHAHAETETPCSVDDVADAAIAFQPECLDYVQSEVRAVGAWYVKWGATWDDAAARGIQRHALHTSLCEAGHVRRDDAVNALSLTVPADADADTDADADVPVDARARSPRARLQRACDAYVRTLPPPTGLAAAYMDAAAALNTTVLHAVGACDDVLRTHGVATRVTSPALAGPFAQRNATLEWTAPVPVHRGTLAPGAGAIPPRRALTLSWTSWIDVAVRAAE